MGIFQLIPSPANSPAPPLPYLIPPSPLPPFSPRRRAQCAPCARLSSRLAFSLSALRQSESRRGIAPSFGRQLPHLGSLCPLGINDDVDGSGVDSGGRSGVGSVVDSHVDALVDGFLRDCVAKRRRKTDGGTKFGR